MKCSLSFRILLWGTWPLEKWNLLPRVVSREFRIQPQFSPNPNTTQFLHYPASILQVKLQEFFPPICLKPSLWCRANLFFHIKTCKICLIHVPFKSDILTQCGDILRGGRSRGHVHTCLSQGSRKGQPFLIPWPAAYGSRFLPALAGLHFRTERSLEISEQTTSELGP